jgi:signal peptidase I
VLELSAQNQQLAADLDAATDLNGELATRLASVEAAVQGATDLGTGIEALVTERDQLRESLAAISDGFTEQTERLGQLQPIESFGTADNPLLFDESTEAWITQPVCTGSMEPTIGCEDLLVVYKPAPTDLNVDDIIIFQRPGPNCEGVVAGTLLLHRITRVVSTAADGLMFETKGDANPLVDPCRAPVATVTGKVLAVIQNSRLPN